MSKLFALLFMAGIGWSVAGERANLVAVPGY